MDKPLENYWSTRLAVVQKALEANNFEAHVVPNVEAAHALVVKDLLPKAGARTVAFGGSMTALAAGLFTHSRAAPTSS
jgi:hypothetical protein